MDELAKRRAPLEPGELADDLVAKIKAENPNVELHLLATPQGETVVCKAPSRAEYKRFRAMIIDPGQRPNALETLLVACVVWPTRNEVHALLDRRPGLAEVFGDKLAGIAGVGEDLVEKKL